MLSRLSLRLRVFLIFAGLAVGLNAVIGAALLVAADSVARTIVSPAELPIGIVTALIGTPVFLFLLLGRGSGLNFRSLS